MRKSEPVRCCQNDGAHGTAQIPSARSVPWFDGAAPTTSLTSFRVSGQKRSAQRADHAALAVAEDRDPPVGEPVHPADRVDDELAALLRIRPCCPAPARSTRTRGSGPGRARASSSRRSSRSGRRSSRKGAGPGSWRRRERQPCNRGSPSGRPGTGSASGRPCRARRTPARPRAWPQPAARPPRGPPGRHACARQPSATAIVGAGRGTARRGQPRPNVAAPAGSSVPSTCSIPLARWPWASASA